MFFSKRKEDKIREKEYKDENKRLDLIVKNNLKGKELEKRGQVDKAIALYEKMYYLNLKGTFRMIVWRLFIEKEKIMIMK